MEVFYSEAWQGFSSGEHDLPVFPIMAMVPITTWWWLSPHPCSICGQIWDLPMGNMVCLCSPSRSWSDWFSTQSKPPSFKSTKLLPSSNQPLNLNLHLSSPPSFSWAPSFATQSYWVHELHTQSPSWISMNNLHAIYAYQIKIPNLILFVKILKWYGQAQQ